MRGARALALIGAVAGVAGCGSSGSPHASSSRTDLRVTVWPAGRGKPGAVTRHVLCPGLRADCTAAAGVTAHELAPPSGRVACAALFGGPAEARVVGTLHGDPVDAALSRRDSCEVKRWEAARRLLALTGARIEEPHP